MILTAKSLASATPYAEVVQPGAGFHADPAKLDAKAVEGYAAQAAAD